LAKKGGPLAIFLGDAMSKNMFGTTLVIVFSIFILGEVLAGTITGEVKFTDDPPTMPAVKVSKDQDYCGETLANETYLIASDGALKNVVVFIEAAPSNAAGDPQKENVLNNTGCRYSPRILAMQKGEKLKVRNNDPKLHIPHSYHADRTVFNLSLPFKGTTIDTTQKIRQTGVLKVVCDTHAWMLAYIHVFDHPYFAVTDEQGLFTIPNLPAGTYVLKAWHEDVGVRSQEITVSESGDVRTVFEFTKK
jgi:Polysaccharide lyase family 4, domain II